MSLSSGHLASMFLNARLLIFHINQILNYEQFLYIYLFSNVVIFSQLKCKQSGINFDTHNHFYLFI